MKHSACTHQFRKAESVECRTILLRLLPDQCTYTPRLALTYFPYHGVPSRYLPPGTAYSMPPWCIQRDSRNFSFPLSFWPERWLIASGQLRLEDARLPPSPSPGLASYLEDPSLYKSLGQKFKFVHNEVAFIPFSYGPMNCAGKGLAMLEMRTVVTALLQRFEMRLPEKWDPSSFEREYKDYFNATRPDLPVTLTPRW